MKAAYVLGVGSAAAALGLGYVLLAFLPEVEAVVVGIALGLLGGVWFWRADEALERWLG